MTPRLRLSPEAVGSGMTSQRVRDRLVDRLREVGIGDERVLNAVRVVPRHLFIDEALASRAYEDTALPIGHGQTISQPWVVARMTEAVLQVAPRTVLEVGTGSGYQAAILSRLCLRVYTIERIDALVGRARKVFDRLRYHNIVSRIDDGTEGWAAEAPFDGILVTAGGPRIPDPLLAQLADPGRLVIPVGDQGVQDLQLVEKRDGGLTVRTIEQVRFVDLIGAYGWPN